MPPQTSMLPNFFLVGVPKAGTTALHDLLRGHPDVFMSAHKEPNYFAYPEKPTSVTTRAAYEVLFRVAAGHAVRGDASTDYFHHADAPRRILALVPDARAAVVLRDPAERAYSHYAMLVRSGAVLDRPYEDVLASLLREPRGDPAHHYGIGLRQSLYADALTRYLDLFGPDRFRAYRYSDFQRDPYALLQDLFVFLGIDPSVRPPLSRRNASSVPRNRALHRLLRRPNAVRAAAVAVVPTAIRRRASAWMHRHNQAPLPPLSPAARALLAPYFARDVERVEALLGWDLSAWRVVRTPP